MNTDPSLRALRLQYAWHGLGSTVAQQPGSVHHALVARKREYLEDYVWTNRRNYQ